LPPTSVLLKGRRRDLRETAAARMSMMTQNENQARRKKRAMGHSFPGCEASGSMQGIISHSMKDDV
jgi:hypothetical protein